MTVDELPDIVVYEMSSYMLESLHDFTLDIGVFTSLHQAHIDSHGSADAYVAAKWKLVTHSKQAFLSEQVVQSSLLNTTLTQYIENGRTS